MWRKRGLVPVIAAMTLVCCFTGWSNGSEEGNAKAVHRIVTSDSILSGMVASLLPPHRYSVEAILPPGQCPGHYDVKLSDIEKVKKADLVVSFKGMPYMAKAGSEGGVQLFVNTEGRNWMAPDSYLRGLELLADQLSQRYPEDQARIMGRRKEAATQVKSETDALRRKISQAGAAGKAVIACSMQKEPVEWMGFSVVGEYGRPEAMSVREVARLSRIGKDHHAILVVDNLQSGPDAGKGIAETLRIPHVVLTNFPSEKGYLSTLGENVDAILAAIK